MKIQTKPTRSIALLLAVSIFFTSCSSTTMILSDPSGAKLYLNGEPVGTTPYSHQDTKIVGSSTSVRLELDGYEPLNTSFARNEEADVGAIIGGFFFLIPFLWTMKYKPAHTFQLTPIEADQKPVMKTIQQKNQNQGPSKADRLRELKQLFDEKILTQEEYEKEKKKILEEN